MKTHKTVVGILIFSILTFAMTTLRAEDWRTTADGKQKVKHLISVMPSTANIMIEMGSRYQNLYWAAKKGQWQFAKYQAEEMKSLFKKLMITRPGRARTTKVFLKAVYPNIIVATESQDWDRFSKSFKHMQQQCIQCHKVNKHGFIILGIPGQTTSPILNGGGKSSIN